MHSSNFPVGQTQEKLKIKHDSHNAKTNINFFSFLTHLALIRMKGTGFVFLHGIHSGASGFDMQRHDIDLFRFLPQLCFQLNKIGTSISTEDTDKLCKIKTLLRK